jgi:hypothetical protein
MTELDEAVLVEDAQTVASRVVEWFRARLLVAESQRMAAEDQRLAAEQQRMAADRRVIEVEALLAASEELSAQLQRALDSRILIEQAKGMLAGQYGLTVDAAFEIIRRYARSNRITIQEAATGVLDGTATLEP